MKYSYVKSITIVLCLIGSVFCAQAVDKKLSDLAFEHFSLSSKFSAKADKWEEKKNNYKHASAISAVGAGFSFLKAAHNVIEGHWWSALQYAFVGSVCAHYCFNSIKGYCHTQTKSNQYLNRMHAIENEHENLRKKASHLMAPSLPKAC